MDHVLGLLLTAIALYFYGDDDNLIRVLIQLLEYVLKNLNSVEDLGPIILASLIEVT